jgi:hypothetical protein
MKTAYLKTLILLILIAGVIAYFNANNYSTATENLTTTKQQDEFGQIKVKVVTQNNCVGYRVTVTKVGGGFSDWCEVNSEINCLCAVSAPSGYYNISAINGACDGYIYNYYFDGTVANIDVYIDPQKCY